MCIISLTPYDNFTSRSYYYPHRTEEETEAQEKGAQRGQMLCLAGGILHPAGLPALEAPDFPFRLQGLPWSKCEGSNAVRGGRGGGSGGLPGPS